MWTLPSDFAQPVVEFADSVDQVLVVLVDDLADDLFEHVFHGDQAGNAAVFVQHHGHVVPRPLELLQQDVDRLGLGHEVGLAQQRRPGRVRSVGPLGQFGQQVLGVENADDVVAVLVVDRDPRDGPPDDELRASCQESDMGIEIMSVRGVMISRDVTSPSSITPSIISRAPPPRALRGGPR